MSMNNTDDQCINVIKPSELFTLSTATDTPIEVHHYNTAVVPLKSHANENSFFGSEGLNTCDWQEFHAFDAGCQVSEPKPRVTSLVLPAKKATVDQSLCNTFQGWQRTEEKENLVSMWVEMSDHVNNLTASQYRPIIPKPAMRESDIQSQDLFDHQPSPAVDSEDVYSSSLSLSSDGSSDSVYRVNKKRKTNPKQSSEANAELKRANFKIFHKYKCPDEAQTEAPFDASGNLIEKGPRFEGDLYTPRWQRGEGEDREALCPFCQPEFWLKTKQSAYWYHMNYHHGINSKTGKPYDPPEDYQMEKCGSIAKLSGKCTKCQDWVTICNKTLEGIEFSKDTDAEMMVDLAEINFISWYRHAQKCSLPRKQ